MQLELDADEAEALRVLLDETLRQMSHEIADTDTPSYRQMLRERRDGLRRILDALGGSTPDLEPRTD